MTFKGLFQLPGTPWRSTVGTPWHGTMGTQQNRQLPAQHYGHLVQRLQAQCPGSGRGNPVPAEHQTQQNTSMCAFPLQARQSCWINSLAGMNAAVPTSVLSCLPTISMSSHKIKSNYEQIPAPRRPPPPPPFASAPQHLVSTTSQGCWELQPCAQTFSTAPLRVNPAPSSTSPTNFSF